MAKKKPRPRTASTPVSNFREQLMDMALNAQSTRWGYLQSLMDPRRDIDQECGYDASREHDPQLYRELFDRNPIASRVNKLFPSETWGLPPEIYESEDPKAKTPFEEAWLELGASLGGESWHEDLTCSSIWEVLRRADILSGIGHFGVILLGLSDTADLSEPVEEIDKEGKSVFTAKKKSGNVRNAKQPRRLLYMRVFDETQATIQSLETDPSNPRYGQPTHYNINFYNVNNQSDGQIVSSVGTKVVHWTRIIHVTDNVLSNELMGVPRCKPVLHRLLDLNKLYSGSAEMYWKGAFPGLSIETQPQLQGDVEIDAEAMRSQMFDYMNSLQRYLTLTGMSAKTLSPTVVDPTTQINVQLEAICIELGVPVRIFKGSERGELASSQDAAAWLDRVKDRQRMITTPRLVVPLVNRLIQVGVLPVPKKYVTHWPDMASLSEEEQARVGTLIVDVMAKYIQGGLEVMMTPMDFMMRLLHFSQEEAEGILEAAIEAADTQQQLTTDPAAGQDPGQGGAPPLGPDGQPLPIGPDGNPVGPDGKPVELGPDGQPPQQVDEDGKPVEPVDEEGNPVAGQQPTGFPVPGKTPPHLAAFAKQAARTGRPIPPGQKQVAPGQGKQPIPKKKPQVRNRLAGIVGQAVDKARRVWNNKEVYPKIKAMGLFLRETGQAMPGYGQIFYKTDGSGQCWYVGGDGDGDGFYKLVQRKLKTIPGVKSVTYEAEVFPPKNNKWHQVYPQQRAWVGNAFCPTGPGGGQDNSCAPKGGTGPTDSQRISATVLIMKTKTSTMGEKGTIREEKRHTVSIKDKEIGTIVERRIAKSATQGGGYEKVMEAVYKDGTVLGQVSSLVLGKERLAQHRLERSKAKAGSTSNVFCPTGPGGGVDPTCSPKGGGGGGVSGKGSGRIYNPDVEERDSAGVTKAARVGVPAEHVPPPPPIGKLPNLTEHEREVESKFAEAYEADPDGVADKFRELVKASAKPGEPLTFGTDDAKALTDVWSHPDQDQRAEYRASLNTPLHQTANAIAKRAFVRELDNLQEGDEILVTVGGCGAGKGYALKNVPEALAMKQGSKIIWDSAGDQNATENPWIQKEAEARGLKVNYVYVHADPYKAWADPERGAIQRAKDPKDGRMVDAKVFADSYALGIKNHAAFYEANKDNPSAKFAFLDNRTKPSLMDMIPDEGLQLDRHELSKFAVKAVEQAQAPDRVVRGALIGQRIWAGENI